MPWTPGFGAEGGLRRPLFQVQGLRALFSTPLGEVGITHATGRHAQYPHQLSYGMRQRVMLASALACEAGILIADEPTMAVDENTPAQILAGLLELRTTASRRCPQLRRRP